MSTFNDSGAGGEIKQGKYANGLILLLMSFLGVVASYFSYQQGQVKSEYRASLEQSRLADQKQRIREDSIRAEYQSKLDGRESYHENRYNLLQVKIDSMNANYIAEIKMTRAKSEVLASENRKVSKAFQVEVKKTKEVTKELDSVSNSVSKSLSQ